MSSTIRSSIYPNSSWYHSQTIDSSLTSHEFSFRYRVSCSANFYGSQCSRFCSPLSSHSHCDPQTGEIQCEQGWTGIDCNKGTDHFSNENFIQLIISFQQFVETNVNMVIVLINRVNVFVIKDGSEIIVKFQSNI
jgi:hypothetical protein